MHDDEESSALKTIAAAFIAAVLCAVAADRQALAQQPPNASDLIREIKENAPPAAQPQPVAAPAAEDAGTYGAYRIEEERSRRTLILALIGAGIVSLAIVLGFLKLIGTKNSATMVTAAGLVLVVYATVLVVMIAKAEQQLTAAIGILGAIAGYLFGTATKNPAAESEAPPKE
jgi:ABC-type Co2+ transport system permease subunit